MVNFTEGYRPKPQIKVNICGHELTRTAPTHVNSRLCQFGFHKLVCFDIPDGSMAKGIDSIPRYCTRCNHSQGLLVPPRPKAVPPKLSRAKLEADRPFSDRDRTVLRFVNTEGGHLNDPAPDYSEQTGNEIEGYDPTLGGVIPVSQLGASIRASHIRSTPARFIRDGKGLNRDEAELLLDHINSKLCFDLPLQADVGVDEVLVTMTFSELKRIASKSEEDIDTRVKELAGKELRNLADEMASRVLRGVK